ncbi:MAG TPA: ABC transporter substrate-binding protein [Acidisoma sp.]|jgi:ribose transport system substrate-binding protein|uniref:ABC transporter substrate-binding protein n=1 Tax=Acidisoma sp. TaxID=1872115 RepID=UPI002C4409D2|nr:ABC transporter substrate-binding protein [Acidisoma sp.]HTI01765.1 ABC transporter substrate-binding protein [Acidisoma sp.]
MKKNFLLSGLFHGCLAAAVMGFALGGQAARAQAPTIGFVPSLASDPFFISMHYGAEQEAKKLGVHLIWQGAMGVYSPTAQLPFVNAVLNQHPAGFVLVPTDGNALMPSVNRAVSLHIPVVTADTSVADTSKITGAVTGDNIGGGALAADLLSEALGGKGEVYLMNGLPGTSTDQLRKQGFESKLKSYPGLKYLGFQFSSDQPSHAAQVVRELLLRYPHLAGIFCIDDETAIGVIQGLRNAGKLGQVKVVAYDAEPDEVNALKAGELIGLIAQQPAMEGEMAVKMAYDATKGTQPEKKFNVLPDILIKRETMAQQSQYFYRGQ